MMQQLAHRCLETEQYGQTTIAKFKARSILDEPTIQELGEALFYLADQVGGDAMLLNFTGVQRLSSTMFGHLIAVRKKVHAHGGRVAVCSVHPELARLFEMLNLARYIPSYADEQEALQNL